jgi:hypothetical protein
MSLRVQANADVAAIIGNTDDFGQASIDLVDPAGTATLGLTGLTNDITSAIDPDSGMIVKGRRVHVTLAITSLPAGPRPTAQNDLGAKPWLVSFPRLTSGTTTQYAVTGTWPDDALNSIILELGNYRP